MRLDQFCVSHIYFTQFKFKKIIYSRYTIHTHTDTKEDMKYLLLPIIERGCLKIDLASANVMETSAKKQKEMMNKIIKVYKGVETKKKKSSRRMESDERSEKAV